MGSVLNLEDVVECVRDIRNDGTYPMESRGAILARRGDRGVVVDRGWFLQDRLVYAVYFLSTGRIVGCLESELKKIDAVDESAQT
ncbi:nitrogen fixation protein NifZ [Kyrpidia spormannii]|uniref:Nitrogen fixation protein NifZ n=1 Tax=Kyrpidia spormannii TaxID=2055160 RepID=A0A2K8N6D7_9BACL|nr:MULTISPECIES: nitrogen fixation protein NifZ [Kyrpidia]ATY84898.1 nitrogen fixation protein NifZ [Kyrpidia spormannii]MCL6574622.1 nitrogen fixation protein NifZ [Kyrpidia sp.]CAB3393134.1 Nitrogen fixation protein NifZ [Kyrpidia spormannii]HHY68143.1 nitrogen fixation protein NifZ [Alicyclobacillus sp.]